MYLPTVGFTTSKYRGTTALCTTAQQPNSPTIVSAWAVVPRYSGKMRTGTYKNFEKLIRPIRECSRLPGHHTAKIYGKMVTSTILP
eukprot:SAG11_NODE_275_length_11309_cov_6.090901_14_plen_86_part_00